MYVCIYIYMCVYLCIYMSICCLVQHAGENHVSVFRFIVRAIPGVVTRVHLAEAAVIVPDANDIQVPLTTKTLCRLHAICIYRAS